MSLFLERKGLMAVALCALVAGFVSCNKNEAPAEIESPGHPDDEIVFQAGDFTAETKAGTVGSTAAVIDYSQMPSINVSCTVGSAGSETAVWTNAPFALEGGYYSGGKYWPVNAQYNGYHFYASNAALSHNASGARVSASASTDVVAACLPDPVYKLPNELVFEHIFARIGEVTVTAESGYTVSNVSITVTPLVSGTYDIRAGLNHTDATGWSGTSAGSAVKLADAVGVNANDVYLVPGQYTLTAKWKAALVSNPTVVLDYTATGKTTSLDFVKGKVNKFTAVLGGEMVFGVSLAAWGDVASSVSVDGTPLSFDILTGGSILWKASSADIARTIEYSKDNGASWTAVTSTTSGAAISVSAGDRLMFRGNNAAYGSASAYNCFQVSGGATFKAYGDVVSLLAENNRSSLSAYALKGLFYSCTGLRNHDYKKLSLSSSTLAQGCYQNLFYGCTGLTVAPELCAESVAESCYSGMFQGCTGLVYGPDLVATSLAANCYASMFKGCTSLISSPTLPAITLVSGCYVSLFENCSSLRHIKAMFTTTPTAALCGDWTKGVASAGSFFKSSSATWNVVNSGSVYYGVPAGWTIVPVSE